VPGWRTSAVICRFLINSIRYFGKGRSCNSTQSPPLARFGDDDVIADEGHGARLKKLAAGRIDVAMLNPGRASFVSSAGEAGLRTDDFTVLPKPLARLSNHLVVGKGVAGGAEILARVNKAIAEATADRTIAKIMAEYDQ
jgi:polar amino acid transport system substrate-binding protein